MRFLWPPILFLIKGIVKIELDSACSFATVSVKGAKTSTVTDRDGTFSISVPKLLVSLTFSAIGYQTQKRLIRRSDSSKFILVKLSAAIANLDEAGEKVYLMDANTKDTACAPLQTILEKTSCGQILRGQIWQNCCC